MNANKDISNFSELARKALAAMTEAVDEIKEECRQTGETMVVWRDGKICDIHPEAPAMIREKPAIYGTVRRPRLL